MHDRAMAAQRAQEAEVDAHNKASGASGRAERVAADYLVRFLSAGTTQTVKLVTANSPTDRRVVLAGPGTPKK